jgi:hypothetical protein
MEKYQMGEWGWVINSVCGNESTFGKGYDFFFTNYLSTFLDVLDIKLLCRILRYVYTAASQNYAICAIVGGRSRYQFRSSGDVDIWINSPKKLFFNEVDFIYESQNQDSSLIMRKEGDRLGIYSSKRKILDVYASHYSSMNLRKFVEDIKSPLHSAIIPIYDKCPNRNSVYLHINPPKLTHYINNV